MRRTSFRVTTVAAVTVMSFCAACSSDGSKPAEQITSQTSTSPASPSHSDDAEIDEPAVWDEASQQAKNTTLAGSDTDIEQRVEYSIPTGYEDGAGVIYGATEEILAGIYATDSNGSTPTHMAIVDESFSGPEGSSAQEVFEMLRANFEEEANVKTVQMTPTGLVDVGGEDYFAYYTQPYYEDKQTWVTAKLVTTHAGRVYSLVLNAVVDELADARPAFFAWASSLQWLS